MVVVHDYEDEVWRLITVEPSTCICCYVVAENHYPVSNLSINLGPVALLRIEGRLKGTGVKNRSCIWDREKRRVICRKKLAHRP